jgi:hypothetical protein
MHWNVVLLGKTTCNSTWWSSYSTKKQDWHLRTSGWCHRTYHEQEEGLWLCQGNCWNSNIYLVSTNVSDSNTVSQCTRSERTNGPSFEGSKLI